jgi:hypothetical protein
MKPEIEQNVRKLVELPEPELQADIARTRRIVVDGQHHLVAVRKALVIKRRKARREV